MKPTDLKPFDVCIIKNKSGTVHFINRTFERGGKAINTFRTGLGHDFEMNDAEVSSKVSKAPWSLP